MTCDGILRHMRHTRIIKQQIRHNRFLQTNAPRDPISLENTLSNTLFFRYMPSNPRGKRRSSSLKVGKVVGDVRSYNIRHVNPLKGWVWTNQNGNNLMLRHNLAQTMMVSYVFLIWIINVTLRPKAFGFGISLGIFGYRRGKG